MVSSDQARSKDVKSGIEQESWRLSMLYSQSDCRSQFGPANFVVHTAAGMQLPQVNSIDVQSSSGLH